MHTSGRIRGLAARPATLELAAAGEVDRMTMHPAYKMKYGSKELKVYVLHGREVRVMEHREWVLIGGTVHVAAA